MSAPTDTRSPQQREMEFLQLKLDIQKQDFEETTKELNRVKQVEYDLRCDKEDLQTQLAEREAEIERLRSELLDAPFDHRGAAQPLEGD